MESSPKLKVALYSKSSDFLNPPNKSKAINFLLYGTRKTLNKVCKEGRYIHKSHFFVLEEQTGYILQWLSRKKVLQSSRIPLDKTIVILTEGHKLMKKYLRKLTEKQRILTVKYGNKQKTLVLEFENEDERELFKESLEYFIRRSQILHDLSEIEESFRKNFDDNMSNLNVAEASALTSSNKFNNHSNSNSKNNKHSIIQHHSITEFKHMKEICNNLALNIDIDYLNNKYEEFINKETILEINFEKFKDFLIELLAKRETQEIYLKYSEEEEKDIDYYAPYMNNLQLQEFYLQEQHQSIKIEDINEIIKKSLWNWNNNNIINNMTNSTLLMNQLNTALSFMIFCRILFSENNSIFSHEKSLVYHNMDKPLTEYYINAMTKCFSSHEINPFFKPQNCESYISKAIDRGSRHIEFFLTNLPDNNNEPILHLPETYEDPPSSSLISHQPILFRDVLKLLKRTVFLNNPYPFFLSLRLSKDTSLSEESLPPLLLDILGQDSIYSLPPDHKSMSTLPSPKVLQRKFLLILAGNMPDLKSNSEYLIPLLNTTEYSENGGSHEAGSDEGILDENPAKTISAMPIYSNKNNKANFRVLNSNNLILRLDDQASDEDEEEEKRGSAYKYPYEQNLFLYLDHIKDLIKDPSNNNNWNNGLEKSDKKPGFTTNFSRNPENNDISYNRSHIKLKEKPEKFIKPKQKIKAIRSNSLLTLGSFFEAKIPIDKPDEDIYRINTVGLKDLHKHKEEDLVFFHQKHLSLVYNNIVNDEKIMYFFQSGAHINYVQPHNALDLSILVNFAKFQENGGPNSGYLLKSCNTTAISPSKIIEMTPKTIEKPSKLHISITVLSASQLKSPGIRKQVSPFIEVGLKGLEVDEQMNRIYRTKTIEKNGFNPIFDDMVLCEFVIIGQDLAVIYMQVWDENEELAIENRFLGWFGVPVSCIRSGLRVAPLRDASLAVIDGSLLFCKVDVKINEDA